MARYEATCFRGEGARLYSGRWNPRGVAMVYCSSSLSLAALETFVHVDAADLPDDLVVVHAELPDEVVERLDVGSLPEGWRSIPGPPALQEIGAAWIRSMRSVALAVPSAVVPRESNFLLNPAHPDMAKLRREPPETFAFDPRMRKPVTAKRAMSVKRRRS